MQTKSNQAYAQFGEDVAVMQYFNPGFKGIFVEVGAYLPDALSQTYLLEQNGWTGILVEPQPDRCKVLREKRSAKVYQFACGSPEQAGSELMLRVDGALSKIIEKKSRSQSYSKLIPVKLKTLDSLLEDSGISHVHFLSIDTEGFDFNVLRGFTIGKYHPELIIIEDQGETIANYRHLVTNGYRLVRRTGCNDWYVPQGTAF
jgi:FkbM family methyltransferase